MRVFWSVRVVVFLVEMASFFVVCSKVDVGGSGWL